MRKYDTFPVGRSVGSRLLDPLQPDAAVSLVRQGFVLAGLIWAMGAWLVMGISALATLLLNGPTMPATSASPTSAVTFWAPPPGHAGRWRPRRPWGQRPGYNRGWSCWHWPP